MKTNLLTLVLLLTAASLFAQEKGVSPLSAEASAKAGTTYAIVVGISDYQDELITDLKYADRDAEAFANYLRSPAGGSLDADHLKVLINEQATMGQFAMDLTWLMEVAKAGDKVIIYFSGHGDVENKSVFEPGFLLCWDAPPKVYFSGGSISLANLKLIISSISVGNKADVLVITDACRSGKLSGSGIDGPHATAVNLAQQFANETKILSCQPDEFSIEGEQWGGGRGAFSYHLVNALYGMADRNGDQIITLSEVDRYLEDHVTPEVKPLSQIPAVVGSKTKQLATVDPAILDKIQQQTDQPISFSPIESKGIEDDILAKLDPEQRQIYASFKEALSKKMLLRLENSKPGERYADDFYSQLIEIPILEPLYNTMRRNYAAALLESGQQFMNGLLSSNAQYCNQLAELLKEDLKINIAYLEKTIELLGKDHYMYPTLQSYIHAYRGMGQEPVYDPEKGTESIQHFRKALAIQPELPQVWIEMAFTFGLNLHEYDSAVYYANKAIAAVPNWTHAYTTMALICLTKSDTAEAKTWLDRAFRFDSTSSLILSALGDWYRGQGQIELAKQYLEKSIDKGSKGVCDIMWLCVILFNEGHIEDAERMAKKAIQLFPTSSAAYENLAALYINSGQLEKTEQTWLQYIEANSTLEAPYINLIRTYQTAERLEDAERMAKKAIRLFPASPTAYELLVSIYSNSGQVEKTKQTLLQLIEVDSTLKLPYINLARIYQLAGQPVEAKKYYEKALSVDKNDLGIYTSIAHLHASLEDWPSMLDIYHKISSLESKYPYLVAWAALYNNKLEEAADTLQKFPSDGPNDGSVLMTHASYRIQIRDYKAAEALLLKGIALNDHRKARLMVLLGHVYFATGRKEAGEKIIKDAYATDAVRKHDVGKIYFYQTQGGLFRSAGRYDEAIALFKPMLEVDANDPEIHMELARSYSCKGDQQTALFHLEEALENGYQEVDQLEYNNSFNNIRGTKAWKALLKKYFPEQFKN